MYYNINMKKEKKQSNKIVIYKTSRKEEPLDVLLQKNSIFLTQKQVASLFDVQKAAISKHVKNIFDSEELSKKATVSILETVEREGQRNIVRRIAYYNLDLVLSIGYRVNSKKATQFRIWATKVLKQHIEQYSVNRYVINEKRSKEKKNVKLDELEKTINFLKRIVKNKKLKSVEARGLLEVITDYANSWVILQKYDERKLELVKNGKIIDSLDYDFSRREIDKLKSELISRKQASNIFGQERIGILPGIVKNLEQTFAGKSLYPTIEERAAHLLYFVIKDHPFVDGNKRIGSFLFILFLAKNNYLFDKRGERRINENTLVSLALLIAESDPKEKDTMIALITNLLI